MHNTKHRLFNDYYVNLIDKFNIQKKLRKKMHCILPGCLKGETEKRKFLLTPEISVVGRPKLQQSYTSLRGS